MKGMSELTEALKYNLSFAGCGFLGIYHVGVAVCFKKFAPHLLLQKISGASAGALAATCLLCDMPLGEMTSDFFRIVNEARSHSLGPFSPSFNIQTCLLEGLEKFLPDDAHLKVNGKLHISLTRVYDGKNVIVSQFNSRDDLLQALLCACFIPGFSGILPPRFHGVRYMDGAFSDNLPTLDENTVTVSPFCGESDICPRDDSAQIFHLNWANTSIELSKQNMNRFMRILFPPKPEILSNMCQQGFDDALHFLHRNNLISCTRCLAIQSTFILSKQEPEHYDPECKSCKYHRKEALNGNKMPETVVNVMKAYIENANKGFFGWLIKRPAMFVLRTLSIPATLPCDIVYATLTNVCHGSIEKRHMKFCLGRLTVVAYRMQLTSDVIETNHSHQRILSRAPTVKSSMWGLTKFVLDNLQTLLIPRQDSFREMDEYNESCKSIYEDDPLLKQFNRIEHRTSIVDLRLDDDDGKMPNFEIRGNVLSRRNSAAIPSMGSLNMSTSMSSSSHAGDVDALEQVVNVTQQTGSSLYSYHYMDETDKTMKFTKIFDVTDSDSPLVQSQMERDNNQQLMFDDTDMTMHDDDENDSEMIQHELNILYPETRELSDWKCAEIKVDEIVSNAFDDDDDLNGELSPAGSTSSMDSFYKPEADQTSEHEQLICDDVVSALQRDHRDFATITRGVDD